MKLIYSMRCASLSFEGHDMSDSVINIICDYCCCMLPLKVHCVAVHLSSSLQLCCPSSGHWDNVMPVLGFLFVCAAGTLWARVLCALSTQFPTQKLPHRSSCRCHVNFRSWWHFSRPVPPSYLFLNSTSRKNSVLQWLNQREWCFKPVTLSCRLIPRTLLLSFTLTGLGGRHVKWPLAEAAAPLSNSDITPLHMSLRFLSKYNW